MEHSEIGVWYALRTRPVSWTSPLAAAPEMRCSRIELTSEAAARAVGMERKCKQIDVVISMVSLLLTRLGGSVGARNRGDGGCSTASLRGCKGAEVSEFCRVMTR